MSIYRPITKVAMAFSILCLLLLAIDPFAGFGQTSPPPGIVPGTSGLGYRVFCG